MLNNDTDNDLLYDLLHLSCKSKIAGRFYTCSASSDCCPCCYGHHINRKHTCDTTVSEALSLPLSVSLSIFLLVSLSVCISFSFGVSVSVSLCLCFSLPRVSFLVLHTFFLSLTLSLSVSWSITLIHNRNVFLSLSFLGAQFHAKYLSLPFCNRMHHVTNTDFYPTTFHSQKMPNQNSVNWLKCIFNVTKLLVSNKLGNKLKRTQIYMWTMLEKSM